MGQPIPLYEPLESGTNDNIFLSKSYDATSHFETTTGKMMKSKEEVQLSNEMQTTSRTFTSAQRATSLLLRA
jgi:hypothetical protein